MVEMSYWAPITSIVVGLIAVGFSSGFWRRLFILVITAPRDCQIVRRYIRALIYLWKCQHRGLSVADVFQETATRLPNKPCFVMDDKVWTFSEVDKYSNRVANALVANGYRRGDVVALMLENSLEYVPVWLGMAKVGVISALINTNQRKKALLHSLEIAKCRAFIYGATFKDAVAEVLDSLPFPMTLYQLNDQPDPPVLSVAESFGQLIESQPTEFLGARAEKPCSRDVLLYIYTSGTTGLPKAAIITNLRFLLSSGAFAILSKFRPDDIFYTPLPLYHSAGGTMTVGQALVRGCTVVLRKKFSASQYLVDCRKYSCTAAQYIGEMCRYMLATSPSSADKDHQVRVMYGNGLRAQIWTKFVERFNIAEIREFYASTEGNTNIINLDGKVGAIGYVPWLISPLIPTTLIKADQFTGTPLRGEDGLCEKCGPNEPGLCIGKISNQSSTEFHGYVDQASSSKKVIRDVFRQGDSAFVSGDILQFDDYGYYYFVDRTGDTFRWKGENVSTCEVEAIISNEAGLRDAIVYGVVVGDAEGRAGMVAITDPEGQVNLEKLCERLQKALPPYARPLFVRLAKTCDVTGTCKLRKVDLQKEGFDPSVVHDPLYYLHLGCSYELLTKEVYEKIVKSEIRF